MSYQAVRTFFVYMLSSISGVIYVGVTNDLRRRVAEHKSGVNDGFTKKYHCHKLIYFEEYLYPLEAIAREKELKKWGRKKKSDLITANNPKWRDLAMNW